MASTTNNAGADAATSTGPTPTITSSSDDRPSSKLYHTLTLDRQWNQHSDSWKVTKTTDPDSIPAEQVQPMGVETTMNNDSWKEYCFVVVRKHSRPEKDSRSIVTFKIYLTSTYIIKPCKAVMSNFRGVSWNSEPIKLKPKVLIAYFPRLEEYGRNLMAQPDRTEEDENVLKSIGVLLAHMRKHYQKTLNRISTLVQNHEITYDLLYAILLPGIVITQLCPLTREPRAFRLLAAREVSRGEETYWILTCEYLEVGKNEDRGSQEGTRPESEDKAVRFGMCGHCTAISVSEFDGVEKINSLSAYPIEFHRNPMALKDMLVRRAEKWVSLSNTHHKDYQGIAGRREGDSFRRYSIRSRIMVDKTSFSRIDANYSLPQPMNMLSSNPGSNLCGLTSEELLLAPPIVYGFSLEDKLWLEFNVNYVAEIKWNDEAFTELVLPADRKLLLRGLVEAHGGTTVGDAPRFDDFVHGKGQGLIVNLFGPPGVGKTLSAEAASEHLRRPLYIVGSGDLGTSAHSLDSSLRRALDLAAEWRAVLLIDEADVFLEERSLSDLERNAMVAVFLRQLEYYHGILFMTTNRIRTFDEAFLSRIHISLHFDELSSAAKEKIWRAFLRKAGIDDADLERRGLLLKLAERDINGRQIKNACGTAVSLATSRHEKAGYEHLELVLSAMEEFVGYFKHEHIVDRRRESVEDVPRSRSGPWWGKRLVYRVISSLHASRSTNGAYSQST